jgi:DNA-binding transcriptional MerR regulator
MGQGNRDERCYGIKELAELGGVTRRTVRYYVQRGLLPTPLGTGRGPHYTPAHLERLISIRQLQETGVPLAEIAARLDGVPPTPVSATEIPPERRPSLRARRSRGERGPLNWAALPTQLQGETWSRFVLADGVELHVRVGATSFQPSQLARLVEAARLTLGLQAASHPSGRSKSHERNAAQLSGDVEPHLDPTPGSAH